jgi:hypothetical protein
MPAPLAYGAGLAVGKALPFISKHLLTLLIGGGILGGQALGAYGQSGERKLARGQMELESQIATSSAEAGKKATTESRARAKEYTEQLLKAKREERRESRDVAAMESFTQSQDRQMALILQALQAISARPGGASTQAPAGGGMLGLMRGGS